MHQDTDNASQQPLAENNGQDTPPPHPLLESKAQPPQNSAVLIVKQWLTYGLWSWTLISLSILLTATLSYFILKSGNNYTYVLYVLAALVCLLPISYVADHLYSKVEPEHKRGFAAVIMVIHAVLTFLISLGAFIAMVVTTLSIATSASAPEGKYVAIMSSAIIAMLGALFFVRIMQPVKFRRLSYMFPLIVIIVTSVALIVAIAGPVKSQFVNKQDLLIENNLPKVSAAIDDYVSANKHLPNSLSDVSFNNSYQQDAKLLVTRNLVEYHALSGDSSSINTPVTPYQHYSSTSDALSYRLCVVYKHAKGTSNDTLTQASNSGYIDTSTHPAGPQCYTQKTYIY